MKNSLRILQCLGAQGEGGAEGQFEDIVIGLHKKNIPQQVVMRAHDQRLKKFRDAGIEPIILPFGGLFDFKTKKELKKIIHGFHPNIVHAWLNRATRHCPKSTPRDPFVLAGYQGGYYNLKYYKNTDHIITVTQDIVDHQMKQGWPQNRIHLIPCLTPDEKMDPVQRQNFDTPMDAKLFFALGRLHWKKAFDVLLKAMVQLPDAYLWLAGDGPLKEELQKLAQDLGIINRVRFLGWRTDRAALMQAADVCVFPSRYEPFGLVTIEAWAQKIPLIAARAAGPAATITHEKDGLLVDIDDVDGLASAMRRVIENPDLAENLIKNGRATYEAHYTEEAVVSQYIELYKEIS